MAIGTYGTVRPSDVSPEDVEIIMIYSPTRDQTETIVQKKLVASDLLKQYFDDVNTLSFDDTLSFDLRLLINIAIYLRVKMLWSK